MMSNIAEFFDKNYSKYKTTLKETSYDTVNGEYTTELEISAYNYDDIIKYSVFNSNKISCSPDAILFNEGEVLFIEFKNTVLEQKINTDDKTMLRRYKLKFNDDVKNKLLLKGVEGLYIFKRIMLENNIALKDRLIYILCYNEDKNIYKREDVEVEKIFNCLRELSGYRNASFGLTRLKHEVYYDEVLTLGRGAFEKYISRHFNL